MRAVLQVLRDRRGPCGGAFGVIGIADLARIAGVTVRALRHYEDKGLLQSSRTGQNLRQYDWEARARALTIAQLRRAGLSLADIRIVVGGLDGGAPDLDIVAFVKTRLMARLARIDRERSEVRAMISLLSEPGLRQGADQAV